MSTFRYGLLISLFVLIFASTLAADGSTLFDRLDTNKDGFVTNEEVDSEKKALYERLLRTSDKNGDNRLSRQEFLNGTTKKREGAGIGPFPQGRRPDPQQIFKRFDRNGDGQVQTAELPERLRSGFDRADVNRDGALSADEFPRVLPFFARKMSKDGPIF